MSQSPYTLLTLDRDIDRFFANLASAPRGSTALIYYAGHGVQNEGRNYLFATDFPAIGIDAFELGAVPLDELQSRLGASQTSIRMLFIDACRDSYTPPTRSATRSMVMSASGQDRDMLLVFSTSPGQVALDRVPNSSSQHSPFAEAVLDLFNGSDDLSMGLVQVKARVKELTMGTQVPWTNSSLSTYFKFKSGSGGDAQLAALESERRVWEKARDSNSILQLRRYMQQYPGGIFESDAERLIAQLSNSSPEQKMASASAAESRMSTGPLGALGQMGLSLDKDDEGQWVIASVEASTPFSGKLRQGDVVWKINGDVIQAEGEAADLIYRSLDESRRVQLTVKRYGQPYSVTIR